MVFMMRYIKERFARKDSASRLPWSKMWASVILLLLRNVTTEPSGKTTVLRGSLPELSTVGWCVTVAIGCDGATVLFGLNKKYPATASSNKEAAAATTYLNRDTTGLCRCILFQRFFKQVSG